MGAIERKKEIVAEISDMIGEAQGLVVTDFTGLTVADVSELRRRFRQADVRFRVVKRSLAERAIQGTAYVELKEHITGPTGLAVSTRDATSPARVIEGFIKEFQKGSYFGGLAEGRVVDAKGVKALASVPPREVLLSQLLAQIQSPLSGFAGVLASMIRKLLGTLQAVADEKGKS